MSAMIKFTLLSLLSTAALAVPVIHSGTGSPRLRGTGTGYPFNAGNATDGYYPTGTGRRFRKNRKVTTTTSTRTSTAIVTEYVTVSPGAEVVGAAAAVVEVQPTTTPCSSSTLLTTTTSTHFVTVTVEQAYDVQEPAAPTAAYVAPAQPAAPAAEAPAAEVASASAPEITYKPVGHGLAADVVAAAAPAAAPAAPVYVANQVAAGGSRKRGVAYNDIQYTGCFANKAKVSWAYNWGQVAGSGLSAAFEYVPMLWGTRNDFISNWVGNARAAISAGSTHILGFNEPDLAAQANMDPGTAANAYRTYIHNNFAGTGIRLGSPAVTNGGGDMGLNWLNNFLNACSGCQVDFVAIHWYDSATNVEYFKNHVTEAHTRTGKPVWLTEFGASGSDEQVVSFLQQVLPWLDSQDFVERYSYFMARDGLLNHGTEMSSYGNTFATYNS